MSNSKQRQFMQLYEECHEPFLRYCSALASGKMDTEDLVQDVLLSAYQNFSTIKSPQKLLHYLIRAARNRFISKQQKRHRRSELLQKQKDRLISKGVDIDTLIDVQILYAALGQLPLEQQSALILFHISGFSMKEIATINKASVAAVKMQVSRGRRRLKVLLSDHTQSKPTITFFKAAKSILL